MIKHNYTFQELEEIAQRARRQFAVGIGRLEVEAVLNSLPEDEQWERIAVDDIEKGSEIQIVGVGWQYEFTVLYPESDVICYHPMTGTQITKENLYQYELKLYRKVKPVVHPDPAEHKHIIVTKADNVYTSEIGYFEDGLGVTWVGEHYENEEWFFRPQDIVEWQEAVLVPKNG